MSQVGKVITMKSKLHLVLGNLRIRFTHQFSAVLFLHHQHIH